MPDSRVGAGPDRPAAGKAGPEGGRAAPAAARRGRGRPVADTEVAGSRVAAGSRPAPRQELAACQVEQLAACRAGQAAASPAGLPGRAVRRIGPAVAPAAARVAPGLEPAAGRAGRRARSAAVDSAGYTEPRGPGAPPDCVATCPGGGACRYRGCRRGWG